MPDELTPSEDALQLELAASLDAEPDLAPLLPQLFVDLDDLGVRAVDVVSLFGLTPAMPLKSLRVLDLGCGKGAVAIALAREFAMQCTGVDGVRAFVDVAIENAALTDVSSLTNFVAADMHDFVADLLESALGDASETASSEMDDDKLFDVVSLLALGEVFGDIEETLSTLRACIRPGGYIVIDDALAKESATEGDDETGDAGEDAGEDDDGLWTREEAVEAFVELGFDVVAMQSTESEVNHAWLTQATKDVASRAEALAIENPDLAADLRLFAARQRDEIAEIHDAPVEGVVWLLRAAG